MSEPDTQEATRQIALLLVDALVGSEILLEQREEDAGAIAAGLSPTRLTELGAVQVFLSDQYKISVDATRLVGASLKVIRMLAVDLAVLTGSVDDVASSLRERLALPDSPAW